VAPVTTGSTGSLDGNVDPNRSAVSSTISNLSIAPGATVYIRWTDFNASGSDDGLGVDDFSLTPSATAAVPEPATLGIAGVGVALLMCRRRRSA
jgi:hypothetical protein